MDPLFGWLTTAAAVLSAVAATASWKSAANANRTAKQLAKIEGDRRHTELAPQFQLDARRAPDAGVIVNVKLTGPAALSGLQSLTLWVRDNQQEAPKVSDVNGDISPEELAAVVWGPYRFRSSVDGATPDGRHVAAVALDLGNDRDFVMDPTYAPRWAAQDGSQFWSSKYENAGIRLMLVCETEGQDPWTVPSEVAVPPLSKVS